MAKFEFHIDKKCTIWIRESHQIESESYLEARKIMMDNFRVSATDNTFVMQELQYETLEDLSVQDNDNMPTAELLNPEGDTITDNTI